MQDNSIFIRIFPFTNIMSTSLKNNLGIYKKNISLAPKKSLSKNFLSSVIIKTFHFQLYYLQFHPYTAFVFYFDSLHNIFLGAKTTFFLYMPKITFEKKCFFYFFSNVFVQSSLKSIINSTIVLSDHVSGYAQEII